MSKGGQLKWGIFVALLALAVLVSPAQAINFGDMMNPSQWWGGGTERDRSASDLYGPPGYGPAGPGYGPIPPGYAPYGQPRVPPFGPPPYAPYVQPHEQPGRSLEGMVPPSRAYETPWGAPEDRFGARSPTMRDPWAAEDPAQQRIQELERRIQELERRHQDARGFQPEPRSREYRRDPQWPDAQMREPMPDFPMQEPRWPDAQMRGPQPGGYSAPEFPPLDYQFPEYSGPETGGMEFRAPEYPSQYQPLR